MNNLFLCTSENGQYQRLLEEDPLPNCQLTQESHTANIILADPPLIAPKLPNLQKLQWLQSTFAGVNALTFYPQTHYQLTRMTEGLGLPIAEYIFGWWISHQRGWAHYQYQQDNHFWQPHRSSNLQGKTLLILGSGDIAQAIAKVGQAFGTQNWCINTTGKPTCSFESAFQFQDFPNIAPHVDILINALPDTPQTRQRLNLKFFSAFQNTVFFNIGRGSAVVTSALLAALENNHLQHAFLDVFEIEPLPVDHPFWAHKKITITPHIAAISDPVLVMALFRRNYKNWINQRSLEGKIDWKKGY
jgi:phosphoglycerate dehydrogenase-like enzyme